MIRIRTSLGKRSLHSTRPLARAAFVAFLLAARCCPARPRAVLAQFDPDGVGTRLPASRLRAREPARPVPRPGGPRGAPRGRRGRRSRHRARRHARWAGQGAARRGPDRRGRDRALERAPGGRVRVSERLRTRVLRAERHHDRDIRPGLESALRRRLRRLGRRDRQPRRRARDHRHGRGLRRPPDPLLRDPEREAGRDHVPALARAAWALPAGMGLRERRRAPERRQRARDVRRHDRRGAGQQHGRQRGDRLRRHDPPDQGRLPERFRHGVDRERNPLRRRPGRGHREPEPRVSSLGLWRSLGYKESFLAHMFKPLQAR